MAKRISPRTAMFRLANKSSSPTPYVNYVKGKISRQRVLPPHNSESRLIAETVKRIIKYEQKYGGVATSRTIYGFARRVGAITGWAFQRGDQQYVNSRDTVNFKRINRELVKARNKYHHEQHRLAIQRRSLYE